MLMLWVISGPVLLVLSLTALVLMLPGHGEVRPLATMPSLDSIIPLALITSMMFGTAMIVVAFL